MLKNNELSNYLSLLAVVNQLFFFTLYLTHQLHNYIVSIENNPFIV